MLKTNIYIYISTLVMLAFCTKTSASSIDKLKSEPLKKYASEQIQHGATSLPAVSKALYDESIELIAQGKWRKAREKLLLAANLYPQYPKPMFTLAWIEFLHGESDFISHFYEGARREFVSFNNQAVLLSNALLYLIVSLIGSLIAFILGLTIKYRSFITHKAHEYYKSRYKFPQERLMLAIIIVALAVMRLGAALYSALLLIILWPYINSREKRALATLLVIISIISFGLPYSKALDVAIDTQSATNKLARINLLGANNRLLAELDGITQRELVPEVEFVRGTILYRMKRLDEAKMHLLNAIKLRKGFEEAYINLGNIYYESGDFDRALAGYQNAIEIDSTDAVAYYNMGQVYIKKLLFAKSSLALKRANELGIERFKSKYFGLAGSRPDVFEKGISDKRLWALASAEAKEKRFSIIDGVLRPLLLFPAHLLWLLYVVAAIISIIAANTIRKKWRVTSCENCGIATCSSCSNDEMGIILCRECTKAIEGLSSVKVMEALLRHRRQKVLSRRYALGKVRLLLFPGVAQIFHDKLYSGIIISFIGTALTAALIWGGTYFRAPFSITIHSSLWRLVLPGALFALLYYISLSDRKKIEPRNYRILPAEMWKKEKQLKEETMAKLERQKGELEKETVSLF